jgi:hypothetical protein
MNARRFSRHLAAGRTAAEEHLAALERGYQAVLREAGRDAAVAFASRATALTAATNPKWMPPEDGELINDEKLAAEAKRRTAAAHRRALRAVMEPALEDARISFDVTNPLVARQFEKLGVRAEDMGAAVRMQIANAIRDAYQQGLSITDTATSIVEAVDGITDTRATLLARTDMIGLVNGGSLAAAQLVGVPFKQWLTAQDERVRDSHADADGQTVPLDQPFDVGGASLDYPGDPDGPDEEVYGCRCTIVYVDSADATVASASNHPAPALASGGPMDTSPDVTAAVTINVDDAPADEAAAVPVRWRAILAIEGKRTQDNATLTRMLAEGETTWRDLPLPLGVMYETPHSDEVRAELCGLIDMIYRDPADFRVIWGEGPFNQDEQGVRAAARVADLSLRGVSIDPYVPEVEIFDEPPANENDVAKTLVVMKNAVITAATICPVQAIDGAQISIVASTADGDEQVMPVQIETCFVLTRTVEAPGEPTFVAGVSPQQVEELADRMDALSEQIKQVDRRRSDDAAKLTAMVAAAVEEATVPKKLLSDIGSSLTALSEEISRKPRTVQFERDADGKLAGLREG